MYSIRLIIDQLQRHPYPGTKDSVVPTTKASQTTTTTIDPLLIVEANWIIDSEIEPIQWTVRFKYSNIQIKTIIIIIIIRWLG
jgi:hypothetical protein